MSKTGRRRTPEFDSLPSAFPELSDKEILAIADRTKGAIIDARNRFDPYLIEIGRRGLYTRRGCLNLRDFALQIAGLGGKTLRGIASVWRGVQDKPALKELFLEGSVGWSKIRVVLAIATPETDRSWARTVRTMPKSDLEALVRGLKEQEKFNRADSLLAGQPSSAGRPFPSDSIDGDLPSSAPPGSRTTTYKIGRRQQAEEEGRPTPPSNGLGAGSIGGLPTVPDAGTLGPRRTPPNVVPQFEQGSTADASGLVEQGSTSDAGGLGEQGSTSDAGGLGEQGSTSDAGGLGEQGSASDEGGLGEQGSASDEGGLGEQGSASDEGGLGDSSERQFETLEDWPLIEDDAFRQIRGHVSPRRVSHPFDTATLDLLKRYQERLGEEMGYKVSASQALQHALCANGTNYQIKVILFSERETGLLFGRSQWGVFRTAASLYGPCWDQRTECLDDTEWTACERLLASKAERPHRRAESKRTWHGPKTAPDDGAAETLPGEQIHGPKTAPDDGAAETLPGEQIHGPKTVPDDGAAETLPGEQVHGPKAAAHHGFENALLQAKTDDRIGRRHLPARVRRYIIDRYDGKCAFPGCFRKAMAIHHSDRWGVHGRHRLEHLHPLCTAHHNLAHWGRIDGEDGPIENWRILAPGEQRRVPLHREEIDHRVLANRFGGLASPSKGGSSDPPEEFR